MPDNLSRTLRTEDDLRLKPLAYGLLVLLCLLFFLPGFATMPATDRDESLFAQATKQMIETGNYMDIRFQEDTRYKKPVGIYWLQAGATKILSPEKLDEIWTYRVPSLLGAIIAVLMTAALGTLLFTPMTGFLAAAMLSGCLLLNVEARLAKTDASLLACIMIALYAMARTYMARAPAVAAEPGQTITIPTQKKLSVSRWGVPLAFWTAVAAGVLIKGPLIFLPVLGVVLWLAVKDRTLSWIKDLRPLCGIIFALALIAPWFIAIAIQSQGVFFEHSAGNDMLAKLWEGQNRGSIYPGMHLMLMPLLFYPLSLLVVFAIPDIWKTRGDTAVKFCLGWIIPMWFVFEMAPTKLPHYVLPAYPALAILTAKSLIDGFPGVTTVVRRIPMTLMVGLWLIIGISVAVLATLGVSIFTGKPDLLQGIAGLVFIIALGAGLVIFIKRKIASMLVLLAGSLLFLSVFGAHSIPRLNYIWVSRDIMAVANKAFEGEPVQAGLPPCRGHQIVSVGYHEPSLVFLAGTNTIKARTGAQAADALKNNACRIAVVHEKSQQEFISAFNENQQGRLLTHGTVQGLNLGKNKETKLTVFTLRASEQ